MVKILVWFLILFTLEGEIIANNKRILIGDPDVIDARFKQVERTIATVIAKNDKLQSDLEKEKGKVAALEAKIASNHAHGTTYVQWGRRHCSGTGIEEIYSGYTAGQSYNALVSQVSRFGGPSDILCLPDDPELSNRTIPDFSMLYGAEYEGTGGFAAEDLNEDIPCAVCRNPQASNSMMIPGRKSCYSGWKTEYDGFMASGYFYDSASSFICLDKHLEYVPGGQRNDDGHRVWLTKSVCGSLQCPPYHNDYALYCVVCSK